MHSAPRKEGSMVSRIPLVRHPDLKYGEVTRLLDERLKPGGFYEAFIRPGRVVDIGHKGQWNSPPFLAEAEGLEADTPGYDLRTFPYPDGSIGTFHASHVLEHVPDYCCTGARIPKTSNDVAYTER